MRLVDVVVLSLDGGGEGKCVLCVTAASNSRSFRSSSTRFACSCSPAVMTCMWRAESAAFSLLPSRLLDLRCCCLASALFRRLESGDERLLRGGKKAPVGVVDMLGSGSVLVGTVRG